MGVAYYLTEENVYGALASMAECSAPGSEIVFDYQIPRRLIRADRARVLARLDLVTKMLGEPVLCELVPTELADRLLELGLSVRAELSADTLDEMYFAGPEPGLRVPPECESCTQHWTQASGATPGCLRHLLPHGVTVTNGCSNRVQCKVWTSVDPEP